MTNKEKFLKDNVGFHYEDLSLIRQAELEAVKKELGVSADWMLLALSKDTLENWNKWGFTLMKKAEFKKNIDILEQQINNMSEEKFKNENRKNQKNPQLWVDEKTFRYMWEGVKKQGTLYTDDEAEERGLTHYWTYGNIVQKEQRPNVDLMIAQQSLPEEDWVIFCVSVKEVKVIEIERPM